MKPMRSRWLGVAMWVACMVIPTAVARAQDDELPDYDGRTQGYASGVPTHMDDSGTIGAYFLFVPLAAVTLGLMFRDAKRSHLD